MRRSLVLVLGWLAATLVAVGISWAGVRLVAAQVVEPLPVAIDEVTEEPAPVASPSPSPSASASPSASPSPSTSPSRAPSANVGGAGADDGPSSPGPSVTTAPDDTSDDGPSPSETSGSDDGSEDPDDDEAVAEDPAETRTYSLAGGTVTVEFSSTSVRVIQATPADGFTREVDQEGPTQVEVEFRSDEHRSRLEAWWDGGPRSDIDEDADHSDSGSDDD